MDDIVNPVIFYHLLILLFLSDIKDIEFASEFSFWFLKVGSYDIFNSTSRYIG